MQENKVEIVIKKSSEQIKESWNIHLHQALIGSLYRSLIQKGILTIEDVKQIADRSERRLMVTLEGKDDDEKTIATMLKSYLESFRSGLDIE